MRATFQVLLLLVAAAALSARQAVADVIVLANRAPVTIQVQLKPAAGVAQNVLLPPGDVQPLFVDGRAYVLFNSAGEPKRYLLDANSAYYFGQSADGRIDLQKIGLGDDKNSAEGRTLPGRAGTAPMAMIPVKILVDEEEPARRPFWERRLRERVAAASAVLEKQLPRAAQGGRRRYLGLRRRHDRLLRLAGRIRTRGEAVSGPAGDRLHESVPDRDRPHAHGRHARHPALAYPRPRVVAANERAGAARAAGPRAGPFPRRVAQPGARQRDAAGARRSAGRAQRFSGSLRSR